MKRTLLAIIFAVLLSLMFAPHSGSGRSLLRFAGYAHGPFFIMPSYVDGRQLVLQTIFIAVLFALVVKMPWPRKRMAEIKHPYEVRPRKDKGGVASCNLFLVKRRTARIVPNLTQSMNVQ